MLSFLLQASFDNLNLATYDGFRPTHRRNYSAGSSSKNWGSLGSLKMMTMSEVIPDELLMDSDGVVPTNKAAASRYVG